MVTSKGGSGGDKKGKKPHKNKPTSKKYLKYDGVTRKAKYCPRCGPGVFLADHKTRLYCGKCHYTEFASKTEKVEEKKE